MGHIPVFVLENWRTLLLLIGYVLEDGAEDFGLGTLDVDRTILQTVLSLLVVAIARLLAIDGSDDA